MLTLVEKRGLEKEVNEILKREYSLEPNKVIQVSNVILTNWFSELDNGGSHLSSDLIAADIADISKTYLNIE